MSSKVAAAGAAGDGPTKQRGDTPLQQHKRLLREKAAAEYNGAVVDNWRLIPLED